MTAQPADTGSVMQAVFYRCDSELMCSAVSANSYKLVGIRRQNLLKQQSLWKDRILPEDRDRLLMRLKLAAAGETISAVHKLITDDRLRISVVHILEKLKKFRGDALRGLLIPLTKELDCATIDSAIISQFTHKLGNHFQLINLLVGSLPENAANASATAEIRSAVERAGEFTRAFSQFNQHALFCSGTNLGRIIDSALRSFEFMCDEQGIHLFRDIQDSISTTAITADAALLEQALTAVLQNAFDAVSTIGGSQISVVAERSKDQLSNRSSARILITDNGPGMDEKMMVKAIDPFVTTRQDRDGLGLSTALRTVEMHGGVLRVSSGCTVGAAVEILLPIDSAVYTP